MTSSSTELITDPAAAWFGCVVRRTGADACDVTIPQPGAGTGGSVLARLIQGTDVAAGVCACLAVAPRTAMTSDIFLHVLADEIDGDLTARGSIARAGRGQVVANVDLFDARKVLVATATVNHGVRNQEIRMYLHDVGVGDEFDLGPYRSSPVGPLAEVFLDTGELPVNERTVNPWGIAQGALMTASLVEPAAAEAGLLRVDDLAVRFLAPATHGPVRFLTRSVTDRAGGRLLLGELHDRGTDRTVALISAAGPRQLTSSEGDLR